MKDCLFIGHPNAVTYKDVFPLMKEGILCVGYTGNKSLTFTTPTEDETMDMNVSFYTTLHTPNKEKLILTKTYNEKDYPKYDNYDAINVDRLKDIPYDYDGPMGVPITIMTKNLDDYEIVERIVNENCEINGFVKYRRMVIRRKQL